MTKYLAYDGEFLTDTNHQIYEITRSEYWKRRLQLHKYYKHRTMGRSIIRPRKPQADGGGK